MAQILRNSPGASHQFAQPILDRNITFIFRWSLMLNQWFMELGEDGVRLTGSIPVIIGVDLLQGYNLDLGKFYAFSAEEGYVDAQTINDLGFRVFVYADEEI